MLTKTRKNGAVTKVEVIVQFICYRLPGTADSIE